MIFSDRGEISNCVGYEKLHLKLYGGQFTHYTDCRPIQLIYGNLKSKPPQQASNNGICDYRDEFFVVHTKGYQNPSNFL